LKAKIFLFMFTFIIVSLSALDSYIRNIPLQLPPAYWAYQYTPKQIFPTPDGGVIVLGDCLAYWGDDSDPFTAGDCGAVKLDDDGNCEWQWWSRNFSGWGGPKIIGIDQGLDGRVNFIINNVYTTPEHVYNQMGWIDAQGNHFLQYIQLPYIAINRALRLTDNSIFTIGSIAVYHQELPHPDWLTHACFLRLNAEGDTLSMQDYPSDTAPLGLGGADAYDMELDTDGMPVITCNFNMYTSDSVVKSDWNGNIIWRRDPTVFGGGSSPITKIPLTNELVMGQRLYNNGLYNQFRLYRIAETTLDSLFTITMVDTICVGSYYSIVGYNQGIYLSGFYGEYLGYDYQAYILKYELSGQQDWTWSSPYPMIYQQPTECITVLPDSCVMYVFGNWNFGNEGLTIIKILPDGTANEGEVLPKPLLSLSCYPNPMKTELNIEFITDGSKARNIPMQIYNIKGQLVKSLELSRNSTDKYSTVWDGRDAAMKYCSNGIYLVRMSLNGRQNITRKITLMN